MLGAQGSWLSSRPAVHRADHPTAPCAQPRGWSRLLLRRERPGAAALLARARQAALTASHEVLEVPVVRDDLRWGRVTLLLRPRTQIGAQSLDQRMGEVRDDEWADAREQRTAAREVAVVDGVDHWQEEMGSLLDF